jgi:hypothetical protein
MAATFPIKKVCTKPGMVQFTILRLEARQRTLFAWQDAQAITATLVGTGNWTVTRVWPPCGDANPEAFIDLTGPSSDLELARELEAMLRGESWTVTSPVRETGDVLFAAESGETRAVIEDYKPVMALELSIDEAC